MKHKILTSFVYLVECKYWNALKYIQFIDIFSSLFFARIKFTFHCHLQLHWEILVRRTFFSLSLSLMEFDMFNTLKHEELWLASNHSNWENHQISCIYFDWFHSHSTHNLSVNSSHGSRYFLLLVLEWNLTSINIFLYQWTKFENAHSIRK